MSNVKPTMKEVATALIKVAQEMGVTDIIVMAGDEKAEGGPQFYTMSSGGWLSQRGLLEHGVETLRVNLAPSFTKPAGQSLN